MEDRLVASTAEGYLAYCDGQEEAEHRFRRGRSGFAKNRRRKRLAVASEGAPDRQLHTPWRPQNRKERARGPGRKTMKLKIKLLKGGDFEMEIDAAKKVRHRTPLARLSVSSCCSLLPGH